ncbi:MAG: DNA mismatch endonuclease Vsr [Nitrospinae bacterium]|nr:DNA mismatch endonuclease Vsr [Nitrospinota bacterium]
MDRLSEEQRSYNMSRIRGKDTKPEQIVRKLLWDNGFRYRLHKKDLPGKPDIVFIGKKKAIFVHGCFWHKHDCKNFKWPQSNEEFWREKIEGNALRDLKNQKKLSKLDWKYLIIWECEIKGKALCGLQQKVDEFLLED